MTTDEIKAIQTEVGAFPDGEWGPQSKAACIAYLKSLCPNNPWPRQAERVAFFGAPGTNLTQIDVTGLGVHYEGRDVSRITCNEKVAASLLRILTKISQSEWSWVLADYAGCFAEKALMHGVAGAIDLVSDTNGMRDHWPTDGNMPFGVIKIFAEEGWTSGGAYWGYDGMHFQSTTW